MLCLVFNSVLVSCVSLASSCLLFVITMQLPLPDAAIRLSRLEKDIAEFDEKYAQPAGDHSFTVHDEFFDAAECEEITNEITRVILPRVLAKRKQKRTQFVEEAKTIIEDMYNMIDITNSRLFPPPPPHDEGSSSDSEHSLKIAVTADDAGNSSSSSSNNNEGTNTESLCVKVPRFRARAFHGIKHCHRCGYRCKPTPKPHPTISIAHLWYCEACYTAMQFDNKKRWDGRKYKNDKKLTRFCALCWQGDQLVCSMPECPNRECFPCCKKFRPTLHHLLQVNFEDTPFICLACSMFKA